jgi:EamA domain-containing membrane protein RarD
MSRRDFDPASLVGGIGVIALGVVLMLDQVDTIDLSFGYLIPLLLAVVGSILLAAGLSRPR